MKSSRVADRLTRRRSSFWTTKLVGRSRRKMYAFHVRASHSDAGGDEHLHGDALRGPPVVDAPVGADCHVDGGPVDVEDHDAVQ
jgi:hypothetical protein